MTEDEMQKIVSEIRDGLKNVKSDMTRRRYYMGFILLIYVMVVSVSVISAIIHKENPGAIDEFIQNIFSMWSYLD